MVMTVANILEEALLLSDDARLDLAERLLASTRTPGELLAEQVQIASDRMRALDAGESEEIKGEDAHEQVRKALRSQA